MNKIKVLLACPTSELPRFCEYYDSIDRLIMPPGTDKAPIHSTSPAGNRNIIIHTALERGNYTHIFFTDDDNVYQPDALMRLLARDVDIVSGMYTIKYHPFPIIALTAGEKSGEDRLPALSHFVDMNQYGPNELIEVPRVPSGCLLVKTSALRIMRDWIHAHYPQHYRNKWFTIGHIQPDAWGDDLWFCDRAYDAGLKCYIDTGVPSGHITKCTLWPKYDRAAGKWSIEFKINEGQAIADDRKVEKV